MRSAWRQRKSGCQRVGAEIYRTHNRLSFYILYLAYAYLDDRICFLDELWLTPNPRQRRRSWRPIERFSWGEQDQHAHLCRVIAHNAAQRQSFAHARNTQSSVYIINLLILAFFPPKQITNREPISDFLGRSLAAFFKLGMRIHLRHTSLGLPYPTSRISNYKAP